MTPAEAKLWTYLKGKQLEGRKFRRQHSVRQYILDFYCPASKVAIELDGQAHNVEDYGAVSEARVNGVGSSDWIWIAGCPVRPNSASAFSLSLVTFF